MKFMSATIILSAFLGIASLAEANCGDISGKYISAKPGFGTRVLTIKQKSCDLFNVKLDNGSPGFEETVWANNKPYTYGAHDKSGNGLRVPDGQPIETSLKDRLKIARYTGATLKMMDVVGWRMAADKCVFDATKQQQDCSVTEIVYSLKDSNTLIETQNGYVFQNGNMIPDVIEYKRTN